MRDKLIEEALKAREQAYCPYSGFAVGAALLTEDGTLYTGCNIENASYGLTNCAERTAIFKAVSEGHRVIKAIAVTGGKQGGTPDAYAYPCGACRQVMWEFAKQSMPVYIAKSTTDFEEYTLGDLLPRGFEK